MCLCPLSQCFRYSSLRTNRERWTAGSVVTNEILFSVRQHPRVRSDRLYIKLIANEMYFSERQVLFSGGIRSTVLDMSGITKKKITVCLLLVSLGYRWVIPYLKNYTVLLLRVSEFVHTTCCVYFLFVLIFQ